MVICRPIERKVSLQRRVTDVNAPPLTGEAPVSAPVTYAWCSKVAPALDARDLTDTETGRCTPARSSSNLRSMENVGVGQQRRYGKQGVEGAKGQTEYAVASASTAPTPSLPP